MGSSLFGDFNDEENLSMTISLPKTCYYPGEIIKGKIIIQVKNNKISSIFNFPKSIISIEQYQQYQFYQDNIIITKNDKKNLITQPYRFKKYKNRSILVPLSLPFSIRIPVEADPTFLYEDSNFIKHFLSIEFPKIKCKKNIGIIIQNRQKFVGNKITSSTEKFNDIQRHFLKNYSKVSFLFKTDKNSYAYNEIIPYEIIMNCTESEIPVDHLKVSLVRNIYFGANDKVDSEIILHKKYKMPSANFKKIFKISGHFLFPIISDYFSVNPMNIYNFFNTKILNDFDKNFSDVNLFPTCSSSLFMCCYFLNFEIIFDSFFVKNETLNIPIELYTPLKIEDFEDNKDENEKDNLSESEQTPFGDNSINNMMKYDIQSEKNRIVDKFNFEVINTEDFYKMLTDEKEK
jgi:hypothetical protein